MQVSTLREEQMRIFVSSTFEDLKEHREAVIRGLLQLGHEVVAMEYFTAASAPPVQVVLEKVGQCDAYVGIFAWRYGYVPQEDAASLPAGAKGKATSITHLEYLQAKALDRPRLVFLLDETASWPPQKIDAFVGEKGGRRQAAGTAIRELRQELQRERIVAYFTSPADAEARVATAVTNLGMSLGVKTNLVHLTDPVNPVADSSAGAGIREEIAGASKTGRRVSTVNIADPWWSTRLCRLSALAREFTDIERVVVVENREFVGMLSVPTIINRLEATDRNLALFNAELREIRKKFPDQDAALKAADDKWNVRLPAKTEVDRKSMVTRPNLVSWFGDAMLTGAIDVDELGEATLIDLIRIIAYPNDFVPVRARRGNQDEPDQEPDDTEPRWQDPPIQLIDKRALNEKLAQQYLGELMDKARLT